MPKPGTAAAFLAALKKYGVNVAEVKDWRTHNRNSKGAWGPVHGVMMHHTASGLNGIVDYCYNGSEELPGPLCHGVITKSGSVHLVGWGRANHAGGGDKDVLEAVIREQADLPPTNEHQGSPGAVDGNAHFIGFECVNKGDGNDPWPAVQLEAMQRTAAAVCDLYGWSARSVIRHADWSDWKSDPKGVDWRKFQAAVQALLGGTEEPAEPKPPTKPVVSLAHMIAAARRDPSAPQGHTTYKAEVMLVERALAGMSYLDPDWVDGSFGTRTVEAYRRLQRYLGYTGAAADGIPGAHSLTWLGLRSKLFTKGT